MIWFYWRRMRLGVLVTGIALGSAAALIAIAGSIGPAGEHDPARKAVVIRSGAQLRRPTEMPQVNQALVARGVALMNAAVAACRTVSYTGVQMVAWWGTDDSTAYLIQVWHASGEPEVADGAGSTSGWSGSIAEPGTPAADHATAGVLSVSPWMLSLLRANYLIEYA